MQTEKVFDYIVLENKGHYQTYGNMKELLRSYELPLSMLKDTEQLKVHFDKLYSHYYVPPQQSYAEFFQGHRQELMEELAENNQDMSKFNESMSHDLLAFVRSYNGSVSNMLLRKDSQSPACLRSMRDSMKHLLQEKQDLEMEKETLEEEIVIMSMKHHKAEVREECAQRDKDNLQVNLQSAQELIGELRERNCYLEKKLKKSSLLKRVTRTFFQKKNLRGTAAASRCPTGNRTFRGRHGDRGTIKAKDLDADLENSNEDLENIDADLENIDADLENIDADLENSDEDLENTDADLEITDEDCDEDSENSDEDSENSENGRKNSDGDVENLDADLENSEEDLENINKSANDEKEDKTLRTPRGTEKVVTQRSVWQSFIRYIKPKKEKWSNKTPKIKTEVWRRFQSCIVKSQNSSVNNVQFQKLAASLSTDGP